MSGPRNRTADLNSLVRIVVSGLTVSVMPADTFIKGSELSVEEVLGDLNFPCPDEGEDYHMQDREYARGLLKDLQGHFSKCILVDVSDVLQLCDEQAANEKKQLAEAPEGDEYWKGWCIGRGGAMEQVGRSLRQAIGEEQKERIWEPKVARAKKED